MDNLSVEERRLLELYRSDPGGVTEYLNTRNAGRVTEAEEAEAQLNEDATSEKNVDFEGKAKSKVDAPGLKQNESAEERVAVVDAKEDHNNKQSTESKKQFESALQSVGGQVAAQYNHAKDITEADGPGAQSKEDVTSRQNAKLKLDAPGLKEDESAEEGVPVVDAKEGDHNNKPEGVDDRVSKTGVGDAMNADSDAMVLEAMDNNYGEWPS